MSATIAWTKDDIEKLKTYPDFPWLFKPLRDVKPIHGEYSYNRLTGGDAPGIYASTRYTNVPNGFAPVSATFIMIQEESRVASKTLDDDTLVPFIYKDPRFAVVPPRTTDMTSNKPMGLIQSWGCQIDDNPYNGIRFSRLLPHPSFCALGDQQVNSNETAVGMCKIWPKKNTGATVDMPEIYAVHRHLVVWSRINNPDVWLDNRYGDHTLHEEPLIRLNRAMALFRVDWLNTDGNSARPVTLRNILQMSVSNNDSAVELKDRMMLGKTFIDLSSTLDSAVTAYRDSYCEANPDADECACFKKLPKELDLPQYDPVCHDARCKTYGYKLSKWIDGKACADLVLQVCNQVVNMNGNTDSRVVANLSQNCRQEVDKDKREKGSSANFVDGDKIPQNTGETNPVAPTPNPVAPEPESEPTDTPAWAVLLIILGIVIALAVALYTMTSE